MRDRLLRASSQNSSSSRHTGQLPTGGDAGEGTMAGMGRGLLVGAALGMVALTSAASAETIPLPTPAPLPKEGAPSPTRPTAAQGGGSGLAAGFKSLFHLDREPETPATPTPTTTTFNSTQHAQVDKVST